MARRTYRGTQASEASSADPTTDNVGEATGDEVAGTEGQVSPMAGVLADLEEIQKDFDRALTSRDMVDVKNADSKLDTLVERVRGLVNCE